MLCPTGAVTQSCAESTAAPPGRGLTQGEVGDNAGEDEGGEEGQGQDEGVEVAVVALPHAVAHPGAVVIESLWNKGSW